MTAAELWASMAKGHDVAILSPAQRNYLIDLAKAEGIFDANATSVNFPDGRRVKIRDARRLAGGYGGTVSRVSTGRFRAEVVFLIEFETTKLQMIYARHELDYFTREGHKYKIIKS